MNHYFKHQFPLIPSINGGNKQYSGLPFFKWLFITIYIGRYADFEFAVFFGAITGIGIKFYVPYLGIGLIIPISEKWQLKWNEWTTLN